MALLRRLFYRKPPDRLLEIADRVYVFDCCFSTETMEQFEYKNYLDNIVLQLREQFVDSSLMVFNFRDEGKSLVSGLFSLYGITVKDYPCQYLGCPLLPLEMVLHFLRLSERWLMLEGQQNFLLMHCEKGGWPVLAFMLAGLLLYMKQYNGEERTLVMVYKQAPKELLQMLTTLNPQPSHLRYLQYICKMDDELEWPIQPIPFTLDCVILREVPNFDGVGGCRPIVRVYGQDFLTVDKRCNVMLPPSKPRKHARRYKQADNISVKLNVGSCVQGDVVLECLHIDDSLEDERLMFRVMFNTYFIQSHILPLNFENIDVSWDAEQRFTKKFKAEVLFSEFDGESDASTEVASDYDDEVEVGSIDVFFEAVEIFSNLDSQEGQRDAEILSITSTECSPRAELMKTAPFSHFDMEIGLGGSQKNKIDGMVLSLEKSDEKCTSAEGDIIQNNITRVVRSSSAKTTDGDRDTMNSSCYGGKVDGCIVEKNNSNKEILTDSNEDSGIENVLVKEVIISETNSLKDIQMIKEVIISEVTTSKPVIEVDTIGTELSDVVHNSETITHAEANNEEEVLVTLKQNEGDNLVEECIYYGNSIMIKPEKNRKKEKSIIGSTIGVVPDSTEENARVGLLLSVKPHLDSTGTYHDLNSPLQKIDLLNVSNTNCVEEQMKGMEASISNSYGQPSNLSSLNLQPQGSSFQANGDPTCANTSTDANESTQLELKRKSFLSLSTSSIFSPLSPRRNLLRSTSTDLSFLSPLQTKSNQHSIPCSSGRDDFASSYGPPPNIPCTSFGTSKVSSLVHPSLRPLRTVSSLSQSSFEEYLDISPPSPTFHEKHQQHFNLDPPSLIPPWQLWLAKTKENDIYPCTLSFLPLSPSNKYAHHPPFPPPPPPPHVLCTQNNSRTQISEYEQGRVEGPCPSSSYGQSILNSHDVSLSLPQKGINTLEFSKVAFNFTNTREACIPNIQYSKDIRTNSEDTKLSVMVSNSLSSKIPQHGTPPPPPPPPPPRASQCKIKLSILDKDSDSIPLIHSKSSDYPHNELAMSVEQQYPSLRRHEECEVASTQTVIELSSSRYSEYTYQHISMSIEYKTPILSPSVSTSLHADSSCIAITNGPSSSNYVEEVPMETILNQPTLSIPLEACKDELLHCKENGGIPIPPPPPPLCDHAKKYTRIPLPPPPPEGSHGILATTSTELIDAGPQLPPLSHLEWKRCPHHPPKRPHYLPGEVGGAPSPPSPPPPQRENTSVGIQGGIPPLPPPLPPTLGDYGVAPPPPSIGAGAPPPPPPPGGITGVPPPPPIGGLGGHQAPPAPPLPEGIGGVPPPPPVGGLGGPPAPPPPAGFRGGTPPPNAHGGVAPPPPPPRGHGGVGGPPTPPGAPTPPMPPGVPGGPPPPPGGRGLPAPPGGRGVVGHGLTRSLGLNSAATARRSTLKPLHWVKVTRAMQGSLWAEIQKQADANSHSEFDVKELESLFAIAPKTKGGSKSDGASKSLGSKPDKVHLIDLRRANNTEIMLTKIKMPLPDMMSAALALDDSVLDADQLENLIKFCPTKEEMELLKNYTGDKETLGKCEQFFLELMKVPRVESKFRIFAFKIQFQSQIRDVRKNLLTVSSACEELRGSEKLKVIMEKILFLGNKLNQGTPRGQALGFRLDSLLKLTDTRANNSRMTLMHFLCKGLADKSPHLLDFYEEFVNLEAASKTLKEFTDASGADVRSLSALYAEVGKSADALAYYFGEDPAKCPFEQVTSTLLNFVGLFRKAHEENIKQIEADKKKAQKEAEKEANQDRIFGM
uniref:Formin-like protein n=1 Tax=Oryza nivara TaxID=4536 RepID=A0A0E0GY40_ORYNI